MIFVKRSQFVIAPVLLGLAIIFYVLPWAINTSNGLTVGGFDLASWVNLHPASQPNLLVGGLLRLQLTVITLSIAAMVQHPIGTVVWWAQLIILGLLVVAQLPAPDFIDANARQHLLLAGISVIGVLIGLFGGLYAIRGHLWVLLGLVGAGTTIYATNEALELMRSFGLQAYRAGGSTLLIVVYVLLACWGVWQIAETNRAAS